MVPVETPIETPTGTSPQILRVAPRDGMGALIAQLRVELLQRTPRPIGERRRRGKEAECATCTPPPTILLSA